MREWNDIIRLHYADGSKLRDILVTHSRQVADLALAMANRYNAARGTAAIDLEFVRQAAMLHDIGICRTDAPDIHCHGSAPYICHGIIGAEMLRQLGMERHALVCERHTGAGLSLDDIVSQGLPLPHRPMLPVSLEEQVICLADKFFSKTRTGAPAQSLERVRASLARFGPGTRQRLEELVARFDPEVAARETASRT